METVVQSQEKKGKKLHWPEQELSKKSILNAQESRTVDSQRSISHLSPGILKDIFTTGTSSYNVLLQSKEEKRHHSQKQSSSSHSKRCRKPSKSPSSSRSKDARRMKTPAPAMSGGTWYCLERKPAVFVTGSVSSPAKFMHDISVTGSSIVLPPKPKSKVRRHHFSTQPKPKQPQPQLSRSFEKGDDASGKKFCILTAIKPTNLEKEKLRFFRSDYTYNPQFEYASPALPSVLAKHSHASDRFLRQSINIMELTLQKYGSYEKFEQATGGSLLSKPRIWSHVRKYMVKEGCLGEALTIFEVLTTSSNPGTVGLAARNTSLSPIIPQRKAWQVFTVSCLEKTPFYGGLPSSTTPCIKPARCHSVNSLKILASLSRIPVQDGIIVCEPRGGGLTLPNQGVSVKTRCTWTESFRSSDTERASTSTC
ncbi:putative tyrosine carboxypeptidase MATCAP2 isoform X3 [Ochotona princeps]|uniref:putative tyrosine carboxypeptidase MATCAP2 isoform X3 n=1 Tax=Ochotona princeps TaxID=9978 RepID=UPI0027152C43|nr:putative tyrosine carboxypeptidase MATCAP2 isoform X3 [Ochotona princeps]